METWTHVTLCAYHSSQPADEVSKILGLSPSSTQVSGEDKTLGMTRPHGWFLSSEDPVKSTSLTDHFDWMQTQLHGKSKELRHLAERDWSLRVHVSKSEAQGLTSFRLTPEQMLDFGELGLPLDFILFAKERAEDE